MSKISNTEKIKFHVKSGDTVKVTSGNHKGKTGKLIKVLTDKSRVIIEGVNMQVRHIKPTAASPEGGLERREGSIHISNVVLLDPKTGEPTRIGRKTDSNGKLKRYSKKTGEFID